MIIIEEIRNHNLKNAQVYQYKLFKGNLIIGSALVIDYHDDKELHISSIAINPNERHKGYGRQLVQKIIKDNENHYIITAYSGMDLEKFWKINGFTINKKVKNSDGLFEYVKK